MKAKYVNPFTDFGFKKIFGEEASKPLLIDFLTSLLPEANIASLTFKDKEKEGKTAQDRKAIYDIYCDDANGQKIIVELQKAKQNYFKDRTIYYSTFPIQEQAEQGEWDYQLKAVYCVGVLDFTFETGKTGQGEVIHTVQLKNQHNQVFYNKLKFVYLEMPNFNNKENELATRLDMWLYFIKHLEDFKAIPEMFKDKVFEKAFEKAEIAKYNAEERYQYEQSLKVFRDLKGVIDTSFSDGKKEKAIEVARQGKLMGLAVADISRLTGLSEDEIAGL